MCGIYGWQWRRERKPSQGQRLILASILGAQNDNRGGDSWGWYSLMTGTFNKGLGDVAEDARFAAHHDSIICHTRKATTGAKTIDNAHPWRFGHIIGAHNGQVYNHKELCEERGAVEVDSMHIFKALEQGKELDGIRGYGCLEWVDENKGASRINLVRTSSTGDLSIAVTEHGVIWSSLKSHLSIAMRTSGIGDQSRVFELPPESVFAVYDGRLFETKSKLKFEEKQSYTIGYGTYGSQYSLYGPGPRPTPPETTPMFSVTKSIRKTIGRAAAMMPPGGVAFICRECYREVDLQKRCPRGHASGVLVMKEAASTGPVEKS